MEHIFPPDNRLAGKNNGAQVQAVILRILKVMDIVCNHLNISFWLDYGTMLGAVRHAGFIPWDREADIGMLRADFEIFSQNAAAMLPADMFFQTTVTDTSYRLGPHWVEAKLRDRYSNYAEYQREHPQCKWHNGIQVDIFVYDYDGEKYTNLYNRLCDKEAVYFHPDELERLQITAFEDAQFYIPIGHDVYLRRVYGDYTLLPPPSEQKGEWVDVISPCAHKEVLYWPPGNR